MATHDAATAKTEKVELEEGVRVEPQSGVSFPLNLNDTKQLQCVGLMKKPMFGMDLKIYAFGIYANDEKLKELLMAKFGKAPDDNLTEEMFQVIIDSDVELIVKMVFVFAGLGMGMLKPNFNEGLEESVKKLNNGESMPELVKSVLGGAPDYIVLTSGSVIEISRLPGYVLQTKVLGEVVSSVESELLCRAGVNMFLGDVPTDIKSKEMFGTSLLSLF